MTEDQQLFRDSTRRFLEDRSPIGALRKLADARKPFDRALWSEAAAQGWTALFTPEAFGGIAESAEGVVDAAVVAEELGRVVFSGPFLSTSVVADAVAADGSDAQKGLLAGLLAGETITAWCLGGTGVSDGVEPGAIRVVRRDDGYVLSGIAGFVQDAADADHLLVTATGDAGVSQFLIPAESDGVVVRQLEALDLGRTIAHVQFDEARIAEGARLGTIGGAAAQVERQLQIALAIQCAETVGVIDRVMEFTLDWVQQRVAFGRPIGSFQALKHRLADHATQLEGAKAAAAHAARAVQAGAEDAAIAVSVAKSHIGRFGTEIIRDCLHMHGGIGMTWDHDIHFYLRRAISNEALWGAPPVHHERLCRLAGL